MDSDESFDEDEQKIPPQNELGSTILNAVKNNDKTVQIPKLLATVLEYQDKKKQTPLFLGSFQRFNTTC